MEESYMNKYLRISKVSFIFLILFSLKTSLIKSAEFMTKEEAEIVKLTNSERINYKLTQLKIDPTLMNVARYSSKYMAERDESSHHCIDGKRTAQRVKESGYCDHAYSTEIILTYPLFVKHNDYTKVLKSWMGSPEHKKIILNADREEIGVGMATSKKNTTYFTAVFSSKISPHTKKGIVKLTLDE